MQPGRKLAALMEAKQLTQGDVARAAGVSQATVSRVLRRVPQRSGAAYLRLCSYIQLEEGPPEWGPENVFAAALRIWDGSARHATALADLIEASGSLWPDMADAEN